MVTKEVTKIKCVNCGNISYLNDDGVCAKCEVKAEYKALGKVKIEIPNPADKK